MLTAFFIGNLITSTAWIYANWATIAAVAGALQFFALVIVNCTETPKDNEILEKVYRVIEVAGGIITKKAKL